MKVYRSYNKLIITFLVFFALSMSTSLVIRSIVPLPFIVVLSSLIFISTFVIFFEIQKAKVAKSLAIRLFPTEKNTIFIYDNGLTFDFYENLLIVNKQALIICTCHNLAQRKWNKLLKKESILQVILHKNVSSIKVEGENMININHLNQHYTIKHFKYLIELENLLMVNNYEKIDNSYMYVGLDQ